MKTVRRYSKAGLTPEILVFMLVVIVAGLGSVTSCSNACDTAGCGFAMNSTGITVYILDSDDAGVNSSAVTFRIAVQADNQSALISCQGAICGGQSSEITASVGEDTKHNQAIILGIQNTPRSVTISVFRNDVLVGATSFEPNYDFAYYPNGRDCPPTCHGLNYPDTIRLRS